jgi:hypothetical protein
MMTVCWDDYLLLSAARKCLLNITDFTFRCINSGKLRLSIAKCNSKIRLPSAFGSGKIRVPWRGKGGYFAKPTNIFAKSQAQPRIFLNGKPEPNNVHG